MIEGAKITAEKTPQEVPQEEEQAKGPRPLPRRKMSLMSQAYFLDRMLDRCKMHSGKEKGEYAGEATLTLTIDDMAALLCISTTIGFFDYHGAGDYVRKAAERDAERKRGKR